MDTITRFDGPSNAVDVARLVLLLVRRDTGPLTPMAQTMLLALDRVAANGTGGR